MKEYNLMPALTRKLAFTLFFTFSLLAHICAASESDNEQDGQHNNEVVTMSPELATANGIKTQPVTSGSLNLTKRLYGRLIADPSGFSHIRARFDGVITDVKVNIGEQVKRGEVIATIESNESLKPYSITSPFAGRVVARHANVGELSNGQILFSIANYDTVWAQLSVFPGQLSLIKPDQSVNLSHSGFSQSSTVSHITSSTDDKPYSLAYVKIDNGDGFWPVGTLVKVEVTTQRKNAGLVVPKNAIQEYEGQSVVFVKIKNSYLPRPVTTGEADDTQVEILDGLAEGELVVSDNSYLLKADLEKSEAGHEH